MGFGKLIKGIADEISQAREERKQGREEAKLREYQRKQDYQEGRFCRRCTRRGDFDGQCVYCKTAPLCQTCYQSNETHGIVCNDCYQDYACIYEDCTNLSDALCSCCKRQVCQTHWLTFFVIDKNQVFYCPAESGSKVCKYCVEESSEGTFRKHYFCKNCGSELASRALQ